MTKKLLEIEGTNSKNYGWHIVVSSPFPQNAESNYISTSVSHYYDLTKEQQNNGIYDVIYREFIVDFNVPVKAKSATAPMKYSTQQIHMGKIIKLSNQFFSFSFFIISL